MVKGPVGIPVMGKNKLFGKYQRKVVKVIDQESVDSWRTIKEAIDTKYPSWTGTKDKTKCYHVTKVSDFSDRLCDNTWVRSIRW